MASAFLMVHVSAANIVFETIIIINIVIMLMTRSLVFLVISQFFKIFVNFIVAILPIASRFRIFPSQAT